MLVASALAADPCPAEDRPALAVVVWDTRAPTYLGFDFPGQAGDRQEQMRTAAVDALFSASGAGLDAGDHISVFVHGVPEGDAARALRATDVDPSKVYEALRPTIGTAAASFTVAPAEGRLDASRRLSAVTLDLLEACDHCPDERSRGLRPDRQAGDYHPWLVTHHALAQAYVTHGLDARCGEPDDVWLLWVTTGEGSLDSGAVDARLRDSFGELARVWFRRLEAAYWREPVREDRLTKLYRVHRGAADPARVAQAPLGWRDPGGHAAGISQSAQWRRGPIGLDAIPAMDWHVPVPNATVHHGAAWLDVGDGPAAVPVTWTDHEVGLAAPAATRDALIRGLDARADAPGVLSATLDARLWLLPPGVDLFGYPSVRILEVADVSPPPIRVAWVPIDTWQIAIVVSVVGAILALIGALVFVRTRVRAVRVAAKWPDDAPVDLLALRDAASFQRTAVLKLDDTSGFRARRAPLRVRVRLQSFLEPDVPLKPGEFQTLTAAPPWKPDGEGFVLDFARPDGRWAPAPLTVTTRHPAIDFARVRSDRLGIVQVLRVTVADASGRYRPIEETLFHEVRLVSVPGPAAPVVRFDLVPGYVTRFVEARVAGLADAAFEGARVIDLGWLSVANPIGGRWRPLAVGFTVTRAVAVAIADDGHEVPAEVRLRRRDGGDGAIGEVAADARSEAIVTVILPEALREPGRPRWRIRVTLDVATDDGTPEGRRSDTLERAVRVRTTGRPRLLVLDLGTSASRVLLQDLDESRWGFLPFDPADPEPADRPAAWGSDIGAEVHALAADVAARLSGPEVDVIRGSGRIAVHGGPRGEIVALLPNEAPPAWRAAVERALRAGPLGPADVLPIAEAEAAALWYASVAPERLRVLFLDVGGSATDAALVDIDPAANRAAPVTTLATGRGRAGGASLLGPALDALATAAGSPIRWATLEPAEAWALAPALAEAKHQLTDGHPDDAVALTVAGVELRATIAALTATAAWTDALDRLVRAAVAPLLGRRPAPHTLADVDRVVLTGRGALARGIVTRADAALAAWGLPVGRVTRVEVGALKAAGSLGGRLYGLGLAGAFLPAAARFADRLLLIARIDGVPRAFELLAPGQAFLGGDLVGPWVDVPRWEEARLVRTFRAPVEGVATAPWELDARRLRDALVGEGDDDGLPPATTIPFAVPGFVHGAPEAPAARIRARVGPGLEVTVEEAEGPS